MDRSLLPLLDVLQAALFRAQAMYIQNYRHGEDACAEVGCNRAKIRTSDRPNRFMALDYPFGL